MATRRIGATVGSFGMPFDEVLPLAKELGLTGLQLMNAGGEHDAMSLTTDDRKRLADRIRSAGLEITALRANLGVGTDLDSFRDGLAKTKAAVDMASDMDVKVITGCIGDIDPDAESEARAVQGKALTELSLYAADRGRVYGAETINTPMRLMRDVLKTIPAQAIKLNYDPANLVANGIDCVAGVYTAHDMIVHTHVKDAMRHPDGTNEETAPGDGQVAFKAWLGALDAIGFDGFLTIEREAGPNRVADIRRFIEIVMTE